MTPADFAAARRQLGITQLALASALGLDATSIGNYERGITAVPRDVAYTLLRLTRRVGGPCAKCGNATVVVEWHDGPCCGGCSKPLPEAL